VNYGDGFAAKHVLVRLGDLLIEFFTEPDRTRAANSGTREEGRTPALRRHASRLKS